MAAGNPFIKGICNVIFPVAMPLAQQFQLARNAGFEGMEIRLGDQLKTDTPRDEVKRIGDAARKAGIAIVSLWVSQPLEGKWLNHFDAAVREKGVGQIHLAIDMAKRIGCGALLIVPGRLGNGPKFLYGYQDSWDRITAELRKVLPHAQSAKVCLTPENVSNKFLVSPTDMKRFVDQFESPWLQTHFDIGNAMQYGYPQDWILTLGSRMRRVHIKDYKLATRTEPGRAVDLLEGDVDWKDVMAALKSVNYRGFLSPEMGARADDPDYVTKVSKALDKIISLA